ncbi:MULTISPECIES: hypothetical protein [unclassified Microbacterium]|uniref:hypothetical protein n=2 Tax=Microbacterium TaxID=33882 RepID=UPI00214BF43A|nr:MULTISPECIES: hypothetical protein [unclassified Microbacterium]MCR2801007.1 hypothetical protein [Microbacterium sp. zg.Y818]MCR2828129.1 hypothetical protein [Microbacterium sp. zg.Y909]WIM23713.1 hypothetical protein QNO21_06755 [Microbacterium sp. zg-Y818]
MQLGTRWTSGDEPPRSVPDSIRGQIHAVDRAMPTDELGQPRPRWTLTFLEGRPVAELETGVVVSLDADGNAVVGHDPDDEFG